MVAENNSIAICHAYGKRKDSKGEELEKSMGKETKRVGGRKR